MPALFFHLKVVSSLVFEVPELSVVVAFNPKIMGVEAIIVGILVGVHLGI